MGEYQRESPTDQWRTEIDYPQGDKIMSERQEILDVLDKFLGDIHEEASRRLGIVLKRNYGHYEYSGDKFSAYVTFLPGEVELVFDGEEIDAGNFIVYLDLCTSGGEVLGRGIVSASGSSAEIRVVLASSGESVITQLLTFLDN